MDQPSNDVSYSTIDTLNSWLFDITEQPIESPGRLYQQIQKELLHYGIKLPIIGDAAPMNPHMAESYPVIGTVEGNVLHFYFAYQYDEPHKFTAHAELVDTENLNDILSFGNEDPNSYVEITDDTELADDIDNDLIASGVQDSE